MTARKGSHSVFSVRLHLVFVTHYRRNAINTEVLEALRDMFYQVCKKMDCILMEFSGESDHVHLLIDFHPKNSISAVVASLKSSTSRMVKKRFPSRYRQFYRDNKAFWSNSYYCASAGGAPIEVLKQYIDGQAKLQD